MSNAPAARWPRLRRLVLTIATILAAIVAVPFMLMLLIVQTGAKR